MTKYFTKDGDDFVEVKQFTKEDIDAIADGTSWLTTRVEQAKERERNKYADYDDIKSKAEKVETLKSDYEEKLTSLNSQKSELEKQLQSAALEVDKVKIVNEYKLPSDLAEFVVGDNADELRKRAEKLAANITSGVTIDKHPKPESAESDSKKIASSLFGKASD